MVSVRTEVVNVRGLRTVNVRGLRIVQRTRTENCQRAMQEREQERRTEPLKEALDVPRRVWYGTGTPVSLAQPEPTAVVVRLHPAPRLPCTRPSSIPPAYRASSICYSSSPTSSYSSSPASSLPCLSPPSPRHSPRTRPTANANANASTTAPPPDRRAPGRLKQLPPSAIRLRLAHASTQFNCGL